MFFFLAQGGARPDDVPILHGKQLQMHKQTMVTDMNLFCKMPFPSTCWMQRWMKMQFVAFEYNSYMRELGLAFAYGVWLIFALQLIYYMLLQYSTEVITIPILSERWISSTFNSWFKSRWKNDI